MDVFKLYEDTPGKILASNLGEVRYSANDELVNNKT